MNVWDTSATAYEQHSSRVGWYDQAASSLLELLDVAVRTLVDFGCGSGRVARLFLARRRDRSPLGLHLVDRSASMLELTRDMGGSEVTVFRHLDDESLARFPKEEEGHVDAIVCGQAFHLLRDDTLVPTAGNLVARAADLLRTGGCLLVNIPEQAWAFEDGWTSGVYAASCRLWGPTPGRKEMPLFSAPLLRRWAARSGLEVAIFVRTFPFTWSDFVHFYSIPAIGVDRIPGHDAEGRWAYLQGLAPQFGEIAFRCVFARFTRPVEAP